MTLPSKATESPSLKNDFRSSDFRSSSDLRDPSQPEDFAQDNRIYGGSDENRKQNCAGSAETEQQQQQQPGAGGEDVKTCKVCGDTATGMYFGALVCVPCKTFFLRYAGDGFCYECKYSKDCEITTATRTQCKYCRYQKCLRVGMCRRVRPAQVEAQDGQQLCVVCQDVANGVHFGVLTCEGCKKFFRRGLTEQKSYRCRNNQNCTINPSNRNSCRFCRFQKCIKAGMSREAIQMGRPSKMAVFETRPQNRDADTCFNMARDSSRTDPLPPPPPPRGSGPVFRSALPIETGLDYSNRGRSNAMGRLDDRRTAPGGGVFASWIDDPLVGVPRGENGRSPWATGWSMGILSSFAGKSSPSKTASDEGEKSDGSACPDSTMVRDEADPFLPVDYAALQRTLSTSEWGRVDDDYPRDWTGESRREPPHSFAGGGGGGTGYRETSPVGPTGAAKCKMETLSSDDDGPSGLKRGRYDGQLRAGGGGGDDSMLPQSGFYLVDGPAKYSSPIQDKNDPLYSEGVRNLSFHHPVSDVTSSELLGGLGSSAGSYSGVLQPLDESISSSGLSTSAILVQPVGTDAHVYSPSISSSSGHPLEALKLEKPDQRYRSTTKTSSFSSSEGDHKSARTDREFARERADYPTRSSTGLVATPSRDSGTGSCDNELETPYEDVGNQCWQTIKRVIPAYHRFVSAGTAINHQLKEAYEAWKKNNPKSDCADELSLWIQTTVVPAYTTASVAYCKNLPDFTDLNAVDQRTLIAGGQSQSRILAAALHWYDTTEKRFRNFLSWRADTAHRPDSFKGKLRMFAEQITRLHLDPIEAALLNALGVFSSGYPNLQDRRSIETIRDKILTTMKSYITANCATPTDRLESLCSVLEEAEVLGAEHVALTNTRTLGLPPDDAMDTAEDTDAQSPLTTGQAQSPSGQRTAGRSADSESTSDQDLKGIKEEPESGHDDRLAEFMDCQDTSDHSPAARLTTDPGSVDQSPRNAAQPEGHIVRTTDQSLPTDFLPIDCQSRTKADPVTV